MSLEPQILVVDDEQHTREGLQEYLQGCGYDVLTAGSGAEALAMLKRDRPDIVLTDLKMPDMDGIEVLEKVLRMAPDTIVMVLTAYGTVETAVKAMKAGAFHYLTKPINFEELELSITKALHQRKLERENLELRQALEAQQAFGEIVGRSPVIVKLIQEAKQAALSNATILLEGESGTGKELFAWLVHQASERKGKSFVAVHCAALTDTLLTSEMFGHERGAFTGATERKIGRFELAHEGTLFLDEIAELKEDTQVKLLRVLQDGNFERVGGTKTVHVDIRLVCATNKNLFEEVKKGRFREDLYYRVNVVRLTLPPLRERREDIPLLVEHFLTRYSLENRKQGMKITPQAMEKLIAYDWPGNIRELRNVVERMVVLSRSDAIDADQVSIEARVMLPRSEMESELSESDLRGVEKKLIADRLLSLRGNKSKVARSLGISRRTLYRKIDEYKLKH